MRQPYLTRLALGRSVYEPPQWPEGERPQGSEASNLPESEGSAIPPGDGRDGEYEQSYDLRGHPENSASRAAARRLRRAQNDILATIGVCVSVDKDGKLVPSSSIDPGKEQREKQSLAAITSENEFGFWLSAGHAAALLLASSCSTCIRQRFETFTFWSDGPFLDAIRFQLRYYGPWQTLFAGFPTACLFDLLDAGREFAILELRDMLARGLDDKLIDRFANSRMPAKRRRRARRAIQVLVNILDTMIIVGISPVLMFALLQRLGLAPSRPTIAFRSWNVLSLALFPSMPTRWDFRSFLRFLVEVGKSPYPLYLGMRFITERLDVVLRRYVLSLTTRPHSPDELSNQFIRMDLPEMIDLSICTGSFTDEFHNDLLIFRTHLKQLRLKISQFRTQVFRIGRSLLGQQAAEPRPGIDRLDSLESNGHSSPSFLQHHLDPSTTSSHPDSSPSTQTPSPQLSPTSDEEDLLLRALDEQTTVQITTRTGSTDTLHMNVEVNGTTPGAPVFTSSFSASPRPAPVEPAAVERVVPERRHRLTSLTLHPATTLAALVATALSILLRAPLEALLLRSLADFYCGNLLAVGMHPHNRAFRLATRHAVYPRWGWLGVGRAGGAGAAGWRGMGDYVGKMVLCVGMDSALGFGVWQVGCGVALWAGRRWYEWGRL